jgi:hypothetical protein
VTRKFIRLALRGLEWTDLHDLPPYEDRCALLYIDFSITMSCIMFVFEILSGRVSRKFIKLVVHGACGCSVFFSIARTKVFMSPLIARRGDLLRSLVYLIREQFVNRVKLA